ncbi:PEP-CTERM sorting domain-containing protein [Methylobacillus gramineus]|uniref:PEP-CTERM sorting domain-containing protein n=1 Tax=Methylobacillus gramineus TaxID=755169 RepID=UPI001CFFCA0D|nr:PEP-CTERM sorting domain-containing protein [Methylobacillus gramineus]MCB5184461.1 PEP-CTERM sorting domain-containing protein [Methylobacillus gramineus]
MKSLIQVIILMAMLCTSTISQAKEFWRYIPDPGTGIRISPYLSIGIIPSDFTGTMMTRDRFDYLYGAYTPVPSNIIIGGVGYWDGLYPSSGMTYINPQRHENFTWDEWYIAFWNKDNYWDFLDGEVVGWSISPSNFRTYQDYYGPIIEDSIGGRWERITVAVPEPSTYAMLGLGLGVLGYAASRRRKTS